MKANYFQRRGGGKGIKHYRKKEEKTRDPWRGRKKEASEVHLPSYRIEFVARKRRRKRFTNSSRGQREKGQILVAQ